MLNVQVIFVNSNFCEMRSRNPSSFTIPAQLVPLLSQGQALRRQGAGIQCICGWIPASAGMGVCNFLLYLRPSEFAC